MIQEEVTMTDHLKRWIELISSDEALKAEVEAALQGLEKAEQIPLLIEFAKEHGVSLSEEDFEPEDKENLSLDELAAVTGGGSCTCENNGFGSGDGLVCFCQYVGSGIRGMAMPGSCFCERGGTGHTGR